MKSGGQIQIQTKQKNSSCDVAAYATPKKCKSTSGCKTEQHVYSTPMRFSRRRTRQVKRYISCATIWSLPTHLLEYVLTYLHVKDLLNIICTHSDLKRLLEKSDIVWRYVSFTEAWPGKMNLKFFFRASKLRNFEATVKLGMAYLYNEGCAYTASKSGVSTGQVILQEITNIVPHRIMISKETVTQIIDRIRTSRLVKDVFSTAREASDISRLVKSINMSQSTSCRKFSFDVVYAPIVIDTEDKKSHVFFKLAVKACTQLRFTLWNFYWVRADDRLLKTLDNGLSAAHTFMLAESLSHSPTHFSWLLYRPPWSVRRCSKAIVYNQLKKLAEDSENVPSASVLNSVAQIALLEKDHQLAKQCLHAAIAQHHSAHAAYILWKLNHHAAYSDDEVNMMKSVRQLRSIVTTADEYMPARLSLLHLYAAGHYGSLHEEIAFEFSRKTLLKSKSSNLARVFSPQSCVTTSMRHILVDWLIEVASVKGLSTCTLHQAIRMMDCYMKLNRYIHRSQLQLLGIACLVICSRFSNDDVITIWEACWLTDNTYRYQDVVKMIATIITSLGGHLTTTTVLDYIYPICEVAKCTRAEVSLAEYICELSLQHPVLTMHKDSYIACSCVILAKLMFDSDWMWDEKAVRFTGFLLQDLRPCLLHIHEKCFVEETPRDHRDVKLESAGIRFSTARHHFVSSIQPISRDVVNMALGGDLHSDEWVQSSANLRLRSQPYLIMSPCRRKSSRLNSAAVATDVEFKAVTPLPNAACCQKPSPSYNVHNAGDRCNFHSNANQLSIESEPDVYVDHGNTNQLSIESELDVYEDYSDGDLECSLNSDNSTSEEIGSCLIKENRISIDLMSPIGAISAHKAGLTDTTSTSKKYAVTIQACNSHERYGKDRKRKTMLENSPSSPTDLLQVKKRKLTCHADDSMT